VNIVPLSQAVYPRMVDLVARGRDAELSALYHASAAGVSVVSGSVAAVLFFMPAEAIYAWSADASLATRVAPILAPAVLGTFLHGLTNIPYQMQLAHGWTGLSLRLHVACAVVYIPVLFAIVPIYGGVGAAWSWVALNLALATFLALLMHRRLLPGEFARWLLSDVAAPMAAAIAVAVIAGRLIAPLESSRLGLAFALIGIGMVTVAAAALVVPAVRRGSFAALRKAWV
jgi:O-antigen/teichoic acid export membrane protein